MGIILDICPQNPILVIKALFVKTSGPVSWAGGKSLSAFDLARIFGLGFLGSQVGCLRV